jgi:phospholipid transport system substrate-binding protein
MMTRRALLIAAFATASLAGPMARFAPAWAQSPEQASAFIDQTGKALIGVVNGPGTAAEKRAQLQQIIDRDVDVDAVARFCLGRYWRTATPAQQRQYVTLFHQVLTNNITGKIGEFKGVTFQLGRAQPGDGGVTVQTIVTRPGTAPTNVQWIVSSDSGSPRIIDVVAEGTSLRLTQRSDYASYLTHNNESVQALLDAMKRQVETAG